MVLKMRIKKTIEMVKDEAIALKKKKKIKDATLMLRVKSIIAIGEGEASGLEEQHERG